MSERSVDTQWILSKLEDNGQTQAELAEYLGLHKSRVTRLLSGERGMKFSEDEKIANFLRVSVQSVREKFGVSVDLDGKPTSFLLAAEIDGNGNISAVTKPSAVPQYLIDKARAAILDSKQVILAAQIKADAGPLALMDDVVVLFTQTEIVEPSAVNCLSICRLQDGDQFLAKVASVRKTGEARVIRVTGKQEEVTLETATPVIAILP